MLISFPLDVDKNSAGYDIFEFRNDERKKVGKMHFNEKVLFVKREKRWFFQTKEKMFRQYILSFQDKENKTEAKNSYTSDGGTSLILFGDIKRNFTYTKNGETISFSLDYRNELGIYFYEFPFKEETYRVYFDDSSTNFKILKNGQIIAKWETISYERVNFEIEEKYKEDFWLWYNVFGHLYFFSK